MADPYTPRFFGTSVAPSGTGSFDASAIGIMHALYIKNSGDTPIAINLTSTAPASAGIGNDKHILRENQSMNLDNIEFTVVSFRAQAGGTSAELEACMLPRPGCESGGAM